MPDQMSEYIFHDSITPGRFQISPVHYHTLDQAKSILENMSGSKLVISDYCIQRHAGKWIACIWFDCDRNISKNIQDAIVNHISREGVNSSIWREQRLNVTRISVWYVIPDRFMDELERMETEWRSRMTNKRIGELWIQVSQS